MNQAHLSYGKGMISMFAVTVIKIQQLQYCVIDAILTSRVVSFVYVPS